MFEEGEKEEEGEEGREEEEEDEEEDEASAEATTDQEEAAEPMLMVEAALTVDALFMFTQALTQTTKHKGVPLFCNTTDTWNNGQSVINMMKLVSA